MSIPRIILKKNKEESLKRKHPWIFSGAVAAAEGEPEEGDIVSVYDSEGTFIAKGHCQIGSITVRVLTFEDEAIDGNWWRKRISDAYRIRRETGLACSVDTTCYRLIHGEGDLLPGLIVDIYGDTAVVQCHSVGMYLSRVEISDALRSVYGDKLKAVFDKSAQTVPYNAGLDAVDGYVWRDSDRNGNAPAAKDNLKHNDAYDAGEDAGGRDSDVGYVLENGLKFSVNWERGQKTGFFIDQRENRELVRKYSAGRKVLNTFCYTGGFSAYALAGGATGVDSVDSSRHAVEMTVQNIKLNFGDDAPHNAITADAIRYVREMEDDYYDMIILDPPAFAKHHKVLGNALQGYKRLNAGAISKIKGGGILFTFSCSQAVSREQFRTAVFSAAAIAGRNVRILHQLTQPADHPVNIYHPEGEYLKGLVLYVE